MATKKPRREPFTIFNEEIAPGTNRIVKIPVAPLYTHDDLSLSVHVFHGKRPGPVMFVSAAVHGDEINGVEIIRRLRRQKVLRRLRGTLLAIPIVNVYGFLNHSRYLPDGRDLNRSFPGSEKGSLTARLADTLLREIIHRCTHGIDLHTGARQRINLPQIRADLNDEATRTMAEAFGVPVMLHSRIRDGSLREAAIEQGITTIVYEAGEGLRFDNVAIRAGVRGILNVMRSIGMLAGKQAARPVEPVMTDVAQWIRAPVSGVVRFQRPLGARVARGDLLALISDPLGSEDFEVAAPASGIIIGRSQLPLAHEGDALFNLARFRQHTGRALNQIERFHEHYETDVNLNAPMDPGVAPEDNA